VSRRIRTGRKSWSGSFSISARRCGDKDVAARLFDGLKKLESVPDFGAFADQFAL
jgi:hypothetical protein